MKSLAFLSAVTAGMLLNPNVHAQAEADTPISLQGSGPYYRLTLRAAIHGLAAYTDLRDLRIRNASGNAVPWAWLDNETTAPQTFSQKVPLFALPANPGGGSPDALLTLQLRSDGSLAPVIKAPAAPVAGATPWVIDVSKVRGNLLQARFELAPTTAGVFAYRLEASDDLRSWRPVGGEEQLVKLTHNNQSLERLDVDLGGIRSRFLRLRWSDPGVGAGLTAVNIDSEQTVETAPQQEWSHTIKPERCEANFCDYLLPRGLPARSLRIALTETNTLARIEVFGVPDTSPQAPAHTALVQPLHNPLYVLRRKPDATRPATTPGQVALARTVIYRLAQGQGEARSSDIALDGSVYPRLRLRTDGPVALLGATPPAITVSSTPRTLVFLAQGAAPFKLAWRTSAEPVAAAGSALSLTTLIPGYSGSQPVTAGNALVSLAVSPDGNSPSARTAANMGPAPIVAKDASQRSVWLWAALVAGLLLLAGMAWSLFNSMKKAGQARSG